ncbi:MAG: hypothetical protein ACYDDI_14835 [Candidatus Acidiferrales bacterium]
MTAITALLQPGLFGKFVESTASFRDRAEFGIKSKPLWSASHSPEIIPSGKRSWSLRASCDGRKRFPQEDPTVAFTPM